MSQELSNQQESKSLRSLLATDKVREQVIKALPTHLSADRFLRIAMTAITKTPKLMECTPESFMSCLLGLSSAGLEPDGRRAHLIPYENRQKGVVECQLIIDYKGLAELAMRSGIVSNIHSDIVCENDEFEEDRGMVVKHKINRKEDRGKMYAAYAICRFKDGTERAEVLSKSEIDAIKDRSRAGKSGPWITDYAEMAKKTSFRRLSKWLPLSAEFRDAVDRDDDSFEPLSRDVTPKVDYRSRIAEAKAKREEAKAPKIDEQLVDIDLEISDCTEGPELAAVWEASSDLTEDQKAQVLAWIEAKADKLGLEFNAQSKQFISKE